MIGENILMTVPTGKLYRRIRQEEKKEDKNERVGFAVGGGLLQGPSNINNNFGASINDQRRD